MTTTVIALAAISLLAFIHYHHPVKNTGGDLPTAVLVAKTLIQKGTAGNVIAAGRLYSVETLRLSEVPKGALLDPRTLSEKVARQDIEPGALLTAAEFAPSSSRR